MAGEKIPNWECLFFHREKRMFLSVDVDGIKLAGKRQNLDPMWKLFNKEVNLGEPTSFLDNVHLGYNAKQARILQTNTEPCSNREFQRVGGWKLPFPQNLRISSWSYDMAGQRNATTPQSIYSRHRWPPHQRKRNEICWRIAKSVLSNCSEMLKLGTYWKT